ncbi:MAG: NapC/NirT family cytochrome c [Notoacmeibacter sp.]|nr:NapC/NirT family cytochrome c [Notoacmeibacter sp.]
MKWIGGLTGLAAFAGLAVGVIAGAPVADGVDRYFSSNAFCAETCHVMTTTVAAELAESIHGTTKTGVVPECSDCHISDNLFGAYVDHAKGMRDLYSKLVKGIDTAEEFETVRFEAANRVRMHLVNNDSKNCRTCHVMEKIKPERTRGQRQHAEAQEKNITCIVCHYDLVHKETPLSEEFEAVVGSY